MNTRGLIDRLLQSGNELLQSQQTGGRSISSAQGSSLSGAGGDLSQFLKGAGGGALAGSAVALLLGNKKFRKMGGKALKYGGAAALGAVAFKALQNWQQNQQAAPAHEPRTLDRVPETEAEQHSQAILQAMLGAARADGHIDDRERALIDEQVAQLTGDRDLEAWVDAELSRPVDPASIAARATTPELAAEMYLASLIMIDEESFMEKAYLDELARRLQLDDALRAEIHAAAREGV